MSTRNTGDAELRSMLPGEPVWLRQVHGTGVVNLDRAPADGQGDAAVTRAKMRVCAIRVADCMPVLFANDAGSVIGAAHAGWRGLSAGVLESTIEAMAVPGKDLIAWLGPAIGPKAWSVLWYARASRSPRVGTR